MTADDMKEREAALRQAVTMLYEHFDSVQIVVTAQVNGDTAMAAGGAGNLYARIGSVDSWLDQLHGDMSIQDANTEYEDD